MHTHTMVEEYLKKVAETTKRGDAREESYYPSLTKFVEDFSEKTRKKKVHVTILPKETEAGNPDFRVWDGKHSQVGYIEAKSPEANLDEVESSEQLKRYIHTFPNLILTNFYEFRLYRHGECVASVLVARPFIAKKLEMVPPAEKQEEFFALLEKFFSFSLPQKFTAETLARELAIRTRFLRDQVIKEELRETKSDGSKRILAFYEAFQKHLITNLTADEFADLYAQTITYGLFAARTRTEERFSRKLAYDLIPKTIGILRNIFHFVSFDPPEQLQATVDDIAEVLAVADVKSILHQFFSQGKGSDPIFHFYETFLAEYNPEERERRGVYYTPEPVVSYIVRSLNILLKEKFGREDGLATPSVTVLDPAGGTLTFIAEAAKLAVEEYVEKYGEGGKGKFVEDHIIRHFFAFELMMAPYAAGHLKMGFLLEELGHKLKSTERFQFYLTNTLEMEELAQTTLPGFSSLSEESHLAAKVKKEKPILVVLGNPPYSGISANASEKEIEVSPASKYKINYLIKTQNQHGRISYLLEPQYKIWKGDKKNPNKKLIVKEKTWIGELVEYYKVVDGKWFGERKHWLQDDYVKFIRFAQWKIDKAGEGIIGFITNHSYLDNPTFRGMRESLLNSFDEIYILDLHGNSLKKEKTPDGGKDENVFDIQQGVAIILMVKQKKRLKKTSIKHLDIWGIRDEKYSYLKKHFISNTKWQILEPSSPFYFFVPKNEKNKKNYERYLKLTDIFPFNVTGIVTARDNFVIDFDERTLRNRIIQFCDLNLDDDIVRTTYKLKDTRGWKLSKARKILSSDDKWKEYFSEILYRPFDIRKIYYTETMIDWGRQELMGHLLQPNLSLVAMRQVSLHEGYNHFLVSDKMVDNRTFASSKGITQQFPLYLYEESTTGSSGERSHRLSMQASFVFEPAAGYSTKRPNINAKLLAQLSEAYKKSPTPENIFYYLYAVLYSNAYRKKYAEFLKSDFPRVPFTSHFKLFQLLAEKGEQLVELHLMKSKKLNKPISKCEGKGTLKVDKFSYDEKNEKVFINSEKYFSGVSLEVWVYHVGGYQVAEKWLKDRKGRNLSSEEVSTYCKVITSLNETINIQNELDEDFKKVEKDLLKIIL